MDCQHCHYQCNFIFLLESQMCNIQFFLLFLRTLILVVPFLLTVEALYMLLVCGLARLLMAFIIIIIVLFLLAEPTLTGPMSILAAVLAPCIFLLLPLLDQQFLLSFSFLQISNSTCLTNLQFSLDSSYFLASLLALTVGLHILMEGYSRHGS